MVTRDERHIHQSAEQQIFDGVRKTKVSLKGESRRTCRSAAFFISCFKLYYRNFFISKNN
jgi:hypothetical protein